MKAYTYSAISKNTYLAILNRLRRTRRLDLIGRVAIFMILVALLISGANRNSSASLSKDSANLPVAIVTSPSAVAAPVLPGASSWSSLFGHHSSLLPLAPPPLTIATYAGDCTTVKSVFNLQDTDKTVCAKITGADADWRIIWSNARFAAVQDVPLGTGQNSFTLTAASSLGDWRVIAYEPFGGGVYALTPFTVVDAANPSADLTISKSAVTSPVAAGSQAVFGVQLTNLGPSDATTVQITDAIPAGTTFSSFALISGPAGFNCVLPTVGASSGNVICTIPNLARGETAVFLAAYDVVSGNVISNTSSVASIADPPTPLTPDPDTGNNSSTAEVVVSGVTSETCTLDCPANVVVTANTTQGGQPGAVVSYAAAAVDGNCGAVTNNPASGSFFTVGTHSVVSTSELGSASCTFTVTVLDTNPPTIDCPPNITATAPTGATDYTLPTGPGTPTINASGGGTVTGVRSDDTPAIFDDNGNLVTAAVVHALTDPYPIGTTGILWTVMDAGGRTASCSQTITILSAGDRDPVTISCPGNVSVPAPTGSCQATVSAATIGTPTTNPSDNVTVEGHRSDGLSLSAPFPAGTTQITWTATDDINGNVASCIQNVNVTVPNSGDTTPPTLTVPANVTTTTSSCTATLDDELGTASATDTGACGGSVTITRAGVPANFIFPTGTTTILYTATDAAGNSATGLQLVTVTESPAIPPTVSAPADVSVNTGAGATVCGSFVSDAALGSATASDNCPGVTVTRSGVPAGNIFPVGITVVTYTATDASGNMASDTQTVTVTDNTPPIVTAPAAVTLYTGAGATSCSLTVSNLDATLGTGTATDNCPGVGAITRSGVPAGNQFPVGNTVVTYSVTDAHGNTASATQTVTVVDNTAPVITLNGQSHSMWPPNHKYKTFQVSDFVASASDNCDANVSLSTVVIETVTSDETENGNGDGNTSNDIVIAADCKSLQLRSERDGGGNGRIYTITFKVTDSSGNVTHATATVVVPHNPGQTAVDSGPHYTVNGTCP